MSRRNRPARRPAPPDPRYGSVLVARFITGLMHDGKKSVAARTMYGVLDAIQERMKQPPIEVLELAVKNVSPMLEVKPRRVGGSTYQIPVEVPPDRQIALAMRWILAAAHSRPGKTMVDKLSGELMDAARETGSAVKKREDTHRMVEANRAFAQYRW